MRSWVPVSSSRSRLTGAELRDAHLAEIGDVEVIPLAGGLELLLLLVFGDRRAARHHLVASPGTAIPLALVGTELGHGREVPSGKRRNGAASGLDIARNRSAAQAGLGCLEIIRAERRVRQWTRPCDLDASGSVAGRSSRRGRTACATASASSPARPASPRRRARGSRPRARASSSCRGHPTMRGAGRPRSRLPAGPSPASRPTSRRGGSRRGHRCLRRSVRADRRPLLGRRRERPPVRRRADPRADAARRGIATLELNLRTQALVCRAVVAQMRGQEPNKSGTRGSILLMGSVTASDPVARVLRDARLRGGEGRADRR